MSEALPADALRPGVLAAAAAGRAMIVTAPTGSGKSTRVPVFLAEAVPGRVLVLEPRRLSARALAARVAELSRTALGEGVGYQVRHDSRATARTKIVFQTYGVFVQRLLREPELPGVDAVALDEFHERTLDADLALAWLTALRRRRPRLVVAAMSATLDSQGLARHLPEAARLEASGRSFPVEVRHWPASEGEGAPRAAARALRELAREGLDGSVLVFLPGISEIRRFLEEVGPLCRERGLEALALHGSMDFDAQARVLEAPNAPRVIAATNVAETGLTVPGVTAVIDSGLHRLAQFDPARGVNALRVARISRANAEQRAGRAGRTAPGRCVRLWSRAEEASMAAALAPEIERLELSSLALSAAALPEPPLWLTPPRPAALSEARAQLTALGALDAAGAITPRGRSLAALPAPPRVAAVIEGARALGPAAFERACAMAAAFESAGERVAPGSVELAEAAGELAAGAAWVPREARETFRRLAAGGASAREDAPNAQDALARLWIESFAQRLGAREGEGGYYRLADGRGVTLSSGAPGVILALDARERGGAGRASRVEAALYLALDARTLERLYPGECAWTDACEFDERAGRAVFERRLLFRGLVLERRARAARGGESAMAAQALAEAYASGRLRHPGFDERVEQVLARAAIARALYPDLGYPAFDAGDWALIYGEAFAGSSTRDEAERADLLAPLMRYLGPELTAHLDAVLPASRRLPSGRAGRFAYFPPGRAELSARLGDFVGMTGTLTLCEGRLPVIFDVQAPNRRTVQKTSDLSSFWANAYPGIKKELQRRYPKHPWP